MSVNRVFLLGQVGRDPEVKEIGGAKYATFSLATSESYKDKNGERQTNTEWHTIVCWRNTAEVVERYVTKGMQLFVEGQLRTRSWEDGEGKKRYVTEIVAKEVQFVGKKESSEQKQSQPTYQNNYGSTPMPMDDGDMPSDDLPF